MATIIDSTTAQSLIKEYQSQNAAANGPAIVTPDGSFLKGYFLDRDSLTAILNNPDVIGVSLHLAKDPNFVGSSGNQFTVLYVGALSNTASNPTTPYISTGDIYGDPPPCPPMCDDLA
jgi:hypothetical protein